MKINIVTVTYGSRFNFLKQVLDAAKSDKNCNKIILIDNNSSDAKKIDEYISNCGADIILIRNKDNKGSAGGFKQGIVEARKHICDYVLLLDDDNVLEDDWSKYFINALDYFPNKDRIILKGNRSANLNLEKFPTKKQKILRIDYLTPGRIIKLFRKNKNKQGEYYPIHFMHFGAIAYGGSLLPYGAILENNPPDENFYLYADDVEYLYRISKNNYNAYQLSRPIIKDVDQTFNPESSNLNSYDINVNLTKLYFMTRNQYALVLMTKSQSKISVIINAVIGTTAKILYAFIKIGVNKFTLDRSKIIIMAVCNGINLNFNNKDILNKIKKY